MSCGFSTYVHSPGNTHTRYTYVHEGHWHHQGSNAWSSHTYVHVHVYAQCVSSSALNLRTCILCWVCWLTAWSFNNHHLRTCYLPLSSCCQCFLCMYNSREGLYVYWVHSLECVYTKLMWHGHIAASTWLTGWCCNVATIYFLLTPTFMLSILLCKCMRELAIRGFSHMYCSHPNVHHFTSCIIHMSLLGHL